MSKSEPLPPSTNQQPHDDRTRQILEFEWHARALDLLDRSVPKPADDQLAFIVGDSDQDFMFTAIRVMMTRKFIYDSRRVDLIRTIKTLRSLVDPKNVEAVKHLDYLRDCAERVTKTQFTLHTPKASDDGEDVDDSKDIADSLVKGFFIHADPAKGEHLRELGATAISHTMTEHWRRVSEVEISSEEGSSVTRIAVWDVVLMALQFIEIARKEGLLSVSLPSPLPALWREGEILRMDPPDGNGGA